MNECSYGPKSLFIESWTVYNFNVKDYSPNCFPGILKGKKPHLDFELELACRPQFIISWLILI